MRPLIQDSEFSDALASLRELEREPKPSAVVPASAQRLAGPRIILARNERPEMAVKSLADRKIGWRAPAPDARKPVGGLVKRQFDLAIASIALILLAPFLLAVSALILLTLGRPVIYGHDRIGYRGRVFRCYKFRTMVANSDEILRKHLAADPAAAQEWSTTQKLRHDPRVTRVGSLLRRSSIDELPQLWNVLRGDMSCVGPRPVIEEELRRYRTHASLYLCARPGMTGIWQVSGRNTIGYDARVELDVRYVQTWSLGSDISILLRTIPAVLRTCDTS